MLLTECFYIPTKPVKYLNTPEVVTEYYTNQGYKNLHHIPRDTHNESFDRLLYTCHRFDNVN